MIPPLDARGMLPAGLHIAELEQVVTAFGITPWRRRLLADLIRWGAAELDPLFVEAVLIGGSFVSDKPSPNDLDVTVVFAPSATDAAARLKAEKARIGRTYRIDVLPNAGEFFQFVGQKEASVRGCSASDLRGLISLIPWHRDTDQIARLKMAASFG